MADKEQIIAAIAAAQADLERAVADLRQLPEFDWRTARYAAHTVGNYLNITAACVHLLGLALVDHPDGEVHSYLQNLERMTELMGFVFRQMTYASNFHEVPLVIETIDLTRMCRRACVYYQSVASSKSIEVLGAPETPAFHVLGDRVAVATVLDNLLSNAVKYSPRGKRVWLRLQSEPEHVVCTVQDEGPGIGPDEQTHLFQVGTRLGTTPTAGELSGGFGLAIAKSLVDRMGGSLWCESVPGKGTSFAFRLPVGAEVAKIDTQKH